MLTHYLAGMSIFMAFFVLLFIFEANTTASGPVPILGKLGDADIFVWTVQILTCITGMNIFML